MLPEIEIVKGKGVYFGLFKNKDLIGKQIRETGSFAAKEALLAYEYASKKNDSIVLDVGANLGSFTIPLAKSLLDSRKRILCFEPQRIVFQQLCANLFLNRLDNVEAFHMALGESSATINIPCLDFSQSTNPGGFSIDSDTRSKLIKSSSLGQTAPNVFLKQEEKVNVYALDDLAIDREISIIKLDVEGHELEFLKGAVNTLKRSNWPPIIYEDWGDKFEWHLKKSQELKNFLTNVLGYKIKPIGGREFLAIHE